MVRSSRELLRGYLSGADLLVAKIGMGYGLRLQLLYVSLEHDRHSASPETRNRVRLGRNDQLFPLAPLDEIPRHGGQRQFGRPGLYQWADGGGHVSVRARLRTL